VNSKEIKYDEKIARVIGIQKDIDNIHSLLNRQYPIAVVEEGYFYIYDTPESDYYKLIKVAPAPMPIGRSVRAAFPLECYENRASVVVTGDVFDSLEGYIEVFHEFVHCYQWNTCEQKLKGRLGLAQKSLRNQDYDWELNYPFPYKKKEFVQYAKKIFDTDSTDLLTCRKKLKKKLDKEQVEYMVWQEWKEGFARYVENKIRRRMVVEEKHSGNIEPYSRTTLYESGSRFIDFTIRQDPDLMEDIEKLFWVLMS